MIEMTIRTTVEIAAPVADAWRVFGEGFGDWDAWAPGIEESTLQGPLAEGVVRVNRAPSLGTVTQELVRYEPGARALAYEMREGLPPFLERLRNDWELESVDGDRCRLSGVALFGIRDAAAAKKPQIEQQMTQVLDGFGAAFRKTLEERA